jgi:hypothetical protein
VLKYGEERVRAAGLAVTGAPPDVFSMVTTLKECLKIVEFLESQ